MNQVMRLTTPSVPYSLLSEMIAGEKRAEENNSRPIQHSAVGRQANLGYLLLPGAGRREPVDVAPRPPRSGRARPHLVRVGSSAPAVGALALAGPASASTGNGTITVATADQAQALMDQGTIYKNVDVPAGADVQLRWVDVHGNVTVEGKLSAASDTFEGNVTVSWPASGLSLFNDPGNHILGNLSVTGWSGYWDGVPNTSLGASSNGQQVDGGLSFLNNTARLYVGGTMHVNGKFTYAGNAKSYTPSDVSGLTIGGTSSIS
jgi:hypothetical protein